MTSCYWIPAKVRRKWHKQHWEMIWFKSNQITIGITIGNLYYYSNRQPWHQLPCLLPPTASHVIFCLSPNLIGLNWQSGPGIWAKMALVEAHYILSSNVVLLLDHHRVIVHHSFGGTGWQVGIGSHMMVPDHTVIANPCFHGCQYCHSMVFILTVSPSIASTNHKDGLTLACWWWCLTIER